MRRRPITLALAVASATALAPGLAPAFAVVTPARAEPTPPPVPSPAYELASPEPSPTEALPAPTQQNLAPRPATVAQPITITSRELSVELDPAFPRVLRYTDRAGGATMGGSTGVPAVVLNGTPYPATVALTGNDGVTARYRLTFPDLAGVTLEASLGVLGGRCAAFTASVGVDDVQATRGSVRYTVEADGAVRARTPVLRAADPAYELSADLTGARYVDLVVDDGGDGNGNDHADWGAARFHCG
ncbi:NPCBM/NEW2 domain-containing protein [Nonomuraea sp. NPDC005983]|uniref:NPCBM/NEW2 domain-containing protein n=1 Tax=Nonomuraea sp. NPDC005983 TaxID=3155595 RepID=UPI0033B02051